MQKGKVIIFGTGDLAQIVQHYFNTDSDFEVAAFTVDNEYLTSNEFQGKPLHSFDDIKNAFPPDQYSMFIAVAYTEMNNLRERKYHEAKSKGYTLVSYISSRCSYLSQFPCGDNCFIFEDNTIQPFVKLGNNIIMWSGNHIGHHSDIKDNVFISSHVVVSGHCLIENNCFLGVNSTLAHKVKLAKGTLVGAGVTLTKDSSEKDVYMAAKPILLDKKSDAVNL